MFASRPARRACSATSIAPATPAADWACSSTSQSPRSPAFRRHRAADGRPIASRSPGRHRVDSERTHRMQLRRATPMARSCRAGGVPAAPWRKAGSLPIRSGMQAGALHPDRRALAPSSACRGWSGWDRAALDASGQGRGDPAAPTRSPRPSPQAASRTRRAPIRCPYRSFGSSNCGISPASLPSPSSPAQSRSRRRAE